MVMRVSEVAELISPCPCANGACLVSVSNIFCHLKTTFKPLSVHYVFGFLKLFDGCFVCIFLFPFTSRTYPALLDF